MKAPELSETVQTTVLPSGVTVISDYYDRPPTDPFRDTLYAAIIAHSGSLQDPIGKNGLAHFAEHMIAHAVPDRDFESTLGPLGLQNYNLGTGDDYTQYYAHGSQAKVEQALLVFATAMHSLAYTNQNLENERPRIINEMANKLIDLSKLRTHFMSQAFFPGQPHAQWRGGTPQDLGNITLSDIRGYHETTHRTGNLTLVTSGAWSHDQACAWAEQHLSSFEPGPRLPRPISTYQPQDVHRKNSWMVNEAAGNLAYFNVFYELPNPQGPELPATQLANEIINKALSKHADAHGIYSLFCSAGGFFGSSCATRMESSNAFDVEKINDLLRGAAIVARDTIRTLDPTEFEDKRRTITNVNDLYYQQEAPNPRNRHSQIVTGYQNFGDPCARHAQRQQKRTLTFEEVRAHTLAVYRGRPSTYFESGEEYPFIKGHDLQEIWNQGTQAPRAKTATKPDATPPPPAIL